MELAHRVAFLDHMAQGRFMLGVGTSGLPSDWKLFNIDGAAGENRRMTLEALDIMILIPLVIQIPQISTTSLLLVEPTMSCHHILHLMA